MLTKTSAPFQIVTSGYFDHKAEITGIVKKKSINKSLEILDYFLNIVVRGHPVDDKFESLNVMIGVRKFPSRIKCATLIWHTLNDAIYSSFV